MARWAWLFLFALVALLPVFFIGCRAHAPVVQPVNWTISTCPETHVRLMQRIAVLQAANAELSLQVERYKMVSCCSERLQFPECSQTEARPGSWSCSCARARGTRTPAGECPDE